MRLIDADVLKKAIIKHLCVKSEQYLLPAEKSIYDLIDKQPKFEIPDKGMTVKQFNDWHMKEFDYALSFVNDINHAIEKSGEEAGYQMMCIGWNANTKQTLIDALSIYEIVKRSMVTKDGDQE